MCDNSPFMKRWICRILPEDEIVYSITETWDNLTDLSIDATASSPPRFTNDAVQKIFDHLLKKGNIRRLHFILPYLDGRYSVELSQCSSLRELVTNVNIVTSENDCDAAVLSGVQHVNIAHFNDMNCMDSEHDTRVLAKWLSRTFPNVETRPPDALFQERRSVEHGSLT